MEKTRTALLTALTTVAFVVGGASLASASTAPDPGAIAGDLADATGSGTLNAVTDALPALIPWIVVFAIVGAVIRRFLPKKRNPLPV